MRKRCAFIVGNGFSMGLIEHAGLRSKIDLTRLIPAAESVRYMPVRDDSFRRYPLPEWPLWKSEIWPLLTEAWGTFQATHGDDQYGFFRRIVVEDSVRRLGTATIGWLRFRSIGTELQFYLLQLFRYHLEVFLNHFEGSPGWHRWKELEDWDWTQAIKKICNQFLTDFIVFNYDVFLDALLNHVLRIKILYNPNKCMHIIENRTAGRVILLKPHGSIDYDPFFGFGGGPNPWLDPPCESLGDISYTDFGGMIT